MLSRFLRRALAAIGMHITDCGHLASRRCVWCVSDAEWEASR